MKFVLSENEYVEAGLLHSRPTPKIWLIALVSVALVGFALGWMSHKTIENAATMAVAVCIGYPLALLAARRWLMPRKLRALYRQHRALAAEMELEWDETGLTMVSPQGRGSEPWSHYRSMREGPNVFILRITDALYHIVPKSALGDVDGIDAFRATAKRHTVASRP